MNTVMHTIGSTTQEIALYSQHWDSQHWDSQHWDSQHWDSQIEIANIEIANIEIANIWDSQHWDSQHWDSQHCIIVRNVWKFVSNLVKRRMSVVISLCYGLLISPVRMWEVKITAHPGTRTPWQP